MSLSIGIIGLPNVGKSTLFNALLKKQVALAANYPFATVEPNVGVVDVPDERLEKLAELVRMEYGSKTEQKGARPSKEIPEKIIPAMVKFVDIAGLVKGASEGEGLGNQFLSHIREVDAIVHVVRDFEDENVTRAGSVDPKSDKEIIETELILADLQVLEKRAETAQKNSRVADADKDGAKRSQAYEKLLTGLRKGELAMQIGLTEEEAELIKDLNLLTLKPMIVVLNVGENAVAQGLLQTESTEGTQSNVKLSAKLESELSDLSEEEQKEYLKELGLKSSGLDRVIKMGYELLGLQTFLTAGPKEVRAWTIKKGSKAPQAAGTIHTDFERGFISAEVISYENLVSVGGWKAAKEKGLIRIEGKNYEMKDGDVVEFRFNV